MEKRRKVRKKWEDLKKKGKQSFVYWTIFTTRGMHPFTHKHTFLSLSFFLPLPISVFFYYLEKTETKLSLNLFHSELCYSFIACFHSTHIQKTSHLLKCKWKKLLNFFYKNKADAFFPSFFEFKSQFLLETGQ